MQNDFGQSQDQDNCAICGKVLNQSNRAKKTNEPLCELCAGEKDIEDDIDDFK